MNVVDRLDEAKLAVLLDAAPHLLELTLHSSPLPYDVLLWVGQRCHELRTLVMTRGDSNIVHYPRAMPSERWNLLSPSPALPLLTTLMFNTNPCASNIRVRSFTRVASYLVHSTPSLRYLRAPYLKWLETNCALVSALGGLTKLEGLWLGEAEWMRQGPLRSYWLERSWRMDGGWGESTVMRQARRGTANVRGDEALSWPRQPWIEEGDRYRIRGGVMDEEEVRAEWCDRVWRFKDEVDGLTGARAFFNAIAVIIPDPLPASVPCIAQRAGKRLRAK